MFGVIRSNLKSLVVGCVLYILFISNVWAQTCNLADADFPSEGCSFNDLNVNKQMLKFSQVDSTFGSNNIRFGAAVYSLPNSALIYDADIGDDDCNEDVNDFNDINAGDEVAFIPSTTDPRIITDIWILDCNIVQDR